MIVGLVEAPGADQQFRVVVPFEPRSGKYVEHAVRAVAVRGVKAATLDFQEIDIFRVELWSDIAGDVSVRHRDAINQPADLMAPADMQLIMGDIGSGHERSDR